MSRVMSGKRLEGRIISGLEKTKGFKIAIIDTTKSESSAVYIKNKLKASKNLGIGAEIFEPKTEKETCDIIKRINDDKSFTGVMVQMPLKRGFDLEKVVGSISPSKDIDCLGPTALGKVMLGCEFISPPTASAVIALLDEYNISIEGRNIVIVNNSNIFGKPLAVMLTNRFATVTLCHIKTRDLSRYTTGSDILITAAGVPGLIKGDMVKAGATVIDAGISVVSGKLVGDVDFDAVSKKASIITPVPGGVGPVTVALLMRNIIRLGTQKMWTYI